MKLSFRLEELCAAHHQKKHGLIQRIVAKTKLKRQQVADLLHNRTKYLSMETLGKICDYLVHLGVEPEQLPGLLFARAAEDFWHLLDCNALTLCLGMRRIEGEAMITHADADLQRAFLHGISSMTVGKPNFESLDHFLVAAPKVSGEVAERDAVEKLYADFTDGGSRALVALGSNKINPVSERIIAGCFGAPPFAFDVVNRPGARRSPLVVSYRDIDPKVPSCCGDTQLARGKRFKKPGIYYELPGTGNQWDHVPWVRHKRDAAFVLFDHRPGRVQMVLAGFSARASRCLADMLSEPESFWPPSHTGGDRQVGVFIVDFRFKDEHDTSPETRVIPLAESVIARRLAK